MSPSAWRAPRTQSRSFLWEAVADIAERSGAAQMVRNTPISALAMPAICWSTMSTPPDSLVYDTSRLVRCTPADVDAEDSVLNCQGIPPLVSSAP